MLYIYFIGVIVSLFTFLALAFNSKFWEDVEDDILTEENFNGVSIAIFVTSFFLSLFSWPMFLFIIIKAINEKES